MKGNVLRVRRFLPAVFALAFVLTALGHAVYAKDVSRAVQIISTDLDDQASVALTVYNVNLGLVKDVRRIALDRGVAELRFMDVAAQIIPTSVHIKSVIKPESLNVLEQNYEYDLLSPQKLLDKYVGKNVKLYQKNPYSEREEIVEATVLSNNGGTVFRIGDEITYGHPGRIIFPGVPEDLISKPTLVWLLDNALSSRQEVEASYLTDGINWQADYVVTLDEKDERADLSGWVTIDNRSGATYREATLKLVAGDVRRVKDRYDYRDRMRVAAEAMAREEQFREEEFFEYHIYTLQRPSTIKNNQTKQIRLVTAGNIPVRKELVYEGARHYFRSHYGRKISDRKVSVFIEIENRKTHNLGIPLPKGIVRAYKYDAEGGLQFVGEDTIDHTPKDEKVRVKVGDAFDLVGTRMQTSWEKIAPDVFEAGYEISLRNHKKEDVVIRVIEPIPGDWRIISASHSHEKTEAFTAEFTIPVPSDGEVKLTYRVRMRF